MHQKPAVTHHCCDAHCLYLYYLDIYKTFLNARPTERNNLYCMYVCVCMSSNRRASGSLIISRFIIAAKLILRYHFLLPLSLHCIYAFFYTPYKLPAVYNNICAAINHHLEWEYKKRTSVFTPLKDLFIFKLDNLKKPLYHYNRVLLILQRVQYDVYN